MAAMPGLNRHIKARFAVGIVVIPRVIHTINTSNHPAVPPDECSVPACGRERLANAAPSMQSGHMSQYSYDVVVIGAGPVGENVADRANQGGLEVCIVEQGLLGGECSYYACIPSKALARPVQASAATGRLGGLRQAVIDPQGVLSRRDRFIEPDDSGQADWLAGAGVALARGRGRLDGRSEEHTSELQSRFDLVCRLLLEKKKE